MSTRKIRTIALMMLLTAAGVCTPSGDEPVEVSLPIVSTPIDPPLVENLEGWSVTLTSLTIAVRDLAFTIEGEAHARHQVDLFDWLVPSAHAHPGHLAGGDVTGELVGDFLLDFFAASLRLGEATLLGGHYHGMNFYFRRAGNEPGLDAADPIIGHTVHLTGQATRGTSTIVLEAVIDIDDATQMVGAPLDLDVDEETSATLALAFNLVDPVEGDTLFDGLDFGALDTDSDGVVTIAPGDPAHNILMKTLVRHDHFSVAVQ